MSIPVLLLDATWRIDRVIGVERACELLLDRRVVPASDDIAVVMHSPSITIEIPSVVARIGHVRVVTGRAPACSHRRVRLRDEHRCQFVVGGVCCDRRGDSVDHLVPRSLGGGTSWSNCVAACRSHNNFKADRTLDDMHRRYGWALQRSPFIPSHGFLLVAGTSSRNPAWLPFLEAA